MGLMRERADLDIRSREATVVSPEERTAILRLCARFTSDMDTAEDLAQETLLEAWRHGDGLRNPDARAAWLRGIARNVCLRWLRRHSRDSVHVSRDDVLAEERADEETDPLAELERHDLILLLDRALALLPPETRRALVDRYIDELPHAEVAARLGLSEAATAARLYRARRALRHVLSTELARESASFGLLGDGDAGMDGTGMDGIVGLDLVWQETRIWCPLCGQHRMQGILDAPRGLFVLRCPACYPTTGVYSAYEWPDLFRGVRGYKPAFNRVMRWVNGYYPPALRRGSVPCEICGRPLPLQLRLPDDVPLVLNGGDVPLVLNGAERGVSARCDGCGIGCSMRLSNLALYLPRAWRFWSAHPRIHMLPERRVELAVAGRPALLISFAEVAGRARLDVALAADTYEVLDVYESHRA